MLPPRAGSLSRAPCGAAGGDKKDGEPKNAEEAAAMYKELMEQENAILRKKHRALGKGLHGGRQGHDHAGGRQKLW